MINEKHYVKGKRKIAKLGVLPGKEGVQLGAGDKSQAKGISSLEFLRLRQWWAYEVGSKEMQDS